MVFNRFIFGVDEQPSVQTSTVFNFFFSFLRYLKREIYIRGSMKLSVVFGLVFSVLLVHSVHCLSFGIRDIGKSLIDTGKGVIDKVPDVIPSADTLFQLGKNAIAGYPFDVAFKVINTFCK